MLGRLSTVSGLAVPAQMVVAVSGSWLLLRWRRRPLPRASTGRLPARGRDVLASRGLGAVEVAVVLGLAAAGGLLGWYLLLQADTRAHLARSQPAEVEVVAVDEVGWLVEVRSPGAGGRSEVGVHDVEAYRVGDRVPARVDATVVPSWVSLDAEPVEHDGWLFLAGASLASSSAVGAARLSALRRRRHLLVHGGPVWTTSMTPGADGTSVLFPTLGLRAPLVRHAPADGLLEEVGLLRHEVTADALGREPVEAGTGSAEEERLRQEEFAAAWRGERTPEPGQDLGDPDDPWTSRQVLLLGDPRPGGVVVAVAPEAVLAPYSSLVPVSALEAWRLRCAEVTGEGRQAAGEQSDDLDGYDAAGLPGWAAVPLPAGLEPRGPDGRRVDEVELAVPWWRRLAVVALVLVPGVFWLTADGSLPPEEQLSWFQSVGAFSVAGSLAFGGLALARSSTRLLVDGVRMAADGFVVLHPWHAVAGVRVIGHDVVVAFGVGDDGDLDGVGGPPVGLDAPTAGGLVERWRQAAGAGSADDAPRPRRTVDPVVGGAVVLYVLAAASSVLVPLVPPLL